MLEALMEKVGAAARESSRKAEEAMIVCVQKSLQISPRKNYVLVCYERKETDTMHCCRSKRFRKDYYDHSVA